MRFWLQSRHPIDDELYHVIERSAERLDVAWIGPVYQLLTLPTRQGLIAPLPNVLLLNLREGHEGDGDSRDLIEAIIATIADDTTPAELVNVASKVKSITFLAKVSVEDRLFRPPYLLEEVGLGLYRRLQRVPGRKQIQAVASSPSVSIS